MFFFTIHRYYTEIAADSIRLPECTAAYVDRLQLDWIKAHSNYAGNERADKLARNAVYVNNIFFLIYSH